MTAFTLHRAKFSALDVNELIEFISEVDERALDPIKSRSYFVGYEELVNRFMRIGELLFAKDALGNLAGCAVIYANPEHYDHAYETYIGVSESFKRQGIGRMLTELEFIVCREIGMKGILTTCHPQNLSKKNLNESCGYLEIRDKKKIASLVAENPKWLGRAIFMRNV